MVGYKNRYQVFLGEGRASASLSHGSSRERPTITITVVDQPLLCPFGPPTPPSRNQGQEPRPINPESTLM